MLHVLVMHAFILDLVMDDWVMVMHACARVRGAGGRVLHQLVLDLVHVLVLYASS